jgi:hypothetical protein
MLPVDVGMSLILYEHNFKVHSQNCEKRLLASSCVSVRMEQILSRRADFHELDIEYFSKSVRENSRLIKIAKNNGYLT